MDSKYIIFDTIISATNREQKVVDDAHFSDGYTTRYCDILKHPTQNLWAVVIDVYYTQLFTQEEIDNSVELTPDWYS
jgi:hypothetical protein